MADFLDAFAPPAPKPQSNLLRGLKQSGYQLAGTGYGLVGLAGAGLGADSVKDYGLTNAAEQFDKSDALSAPTDSVENIESIGDAGQFLSHGLGYVAGQAVPSFITGGVGALLGKQLVKKGIQSTVSAATANQLEKQAMQRGAIAAAGATSYGQEAGSMYPDMVKDGHDEPGRAALYAIPAAALDVIPELNIVRKFLPGASEEVVKQVKGSLLKQVLKEAGKQATMEGVTEALQTVVERQAGYKSLTGPEAWSDYANSAILGMLGGGALGGMAHAVSRGEQVSLLAPPNSEGQGQLALQGGVNGPMPVNADNLDVGPVAPAPFAQQPVQGNLFETVGSEHQYNPDTPPVQGQLDLSGGFAPQSRVDPASYGAGPVQPQAEVAPQQAEMFAPPPAPPPAPITRGPVPLSAPAPVEGGNVIAANPAPTKRTAYGIALDKAQRGQLLTQYERFLLDHPPETPAIALPDQPYNRRIDPATRGELDLSSGYGFNPPPVAPAPTVAPAPIGQVGPAKPGPQTAPTGAIQRDLFSDTEQKARESAKLFGYNVEVNTKPAKARLNIGIQAEERLQANQLSIEDYDQVHTLLAQNKVREAAKKLEQNTKQETPNAQSVPVVPPAESRQAPTVVAKEPSSAVTEKQADKLPASNVQGRTEKQADKPKAAPVADSAKDGQVAPEAPKEVRAPPSAYKKVTVPIREWDKEKQSFSDTATTADKAVASIEEDISVFKQLLTCVKAG